MKRGRIKRNNKINTRSTNLYSHLLIKVSGSSLQYSLSRLLFRCVVIQILEEKNWLPILLHRAEKTYFVQNQQATNFDLQDRQAPQETVSKETVVI